jgi:sugar lactone lactonase YvrE
MEIERIGTIKNALGEGPVWDHQQQRLFWVDSLKGCIFCLDQTEAVSRWQLPCMIGSLATVNEQTLVVALQNGLHFFCLQSNKLTAIIDPESHQPATRFNDGKTDRFGNFIAGTMGITIRDKALGALYRLHPDLTLDTLETDVIVGNGPCFSPDGHTLYFNDGRRRILAYDYSPEGPLRNKRQIFDGSSHQTASDGATVDAQGNIWTALTGSGEVGCISPTGKLMARIKMPIPLPSSVMFAGPALDELYVTSISDSGNRRNEEHGSGGLFRIRGLDSKGLEETRFG